jgi:hypothetical protein
MQQQEASAKIEFEFHADQKTHAEREIGPLSRKSWENCKSLCSQLIDEPNGKTFYSWVHLSVGETFFSKGHELKFDFN